MATDTGITPAALNRITGMLARRYSAQPTPRDLDVANVAAAAERKRIRNRLLTRAAELGYDESELYSLALPMVGTTLAHLLDGDPDGQ